MHQIQGDTYSLYGKVAVPLILTAAQSGVLTPDEQKVVGLFGRRHDHRRVGDKDESARSGQIIEVAGGSLEVAAGLGEANHQLSLIVRFNPEGVGAGLARPTDDQDAQRQKKRTNHKKKVRDFLYSRARTEMV